MPVSKETLYALEQKHALPQGLLNAVMQTESAGNPNAVSPKGAVGLFQFMPQTAQAYGVNPLDPQQSAQGAAQMLADLQKQYQGDVPSMLAAYNWGSGNLAKNGMQNAPKETRDYIQKVTAQLAPMQDNGSYALKGSDLTPEEQAELAQLEALDAQKNQELTPAEQAELAQLEALEAQQATATQPETVQLEQGFIAGVQQDLQKRAENTIKAMEATSRGEQTGLEMGGQYLGQALGLGSDIVGQGVAAGYRALPQGVQEGAKNVVANVLDTDLGRKAADAARYVGGKYSEFEQTNPRAARNVGALANIGSFIGSGIPIKGTSAIGAATQVAKAPIKATKAVGQGVGNVAGAAVAKTLPALPQEAKNLAKLAQKYDIPVSLSQLSDSKALGNIQKVTQELPFSGANAFKDTQRTKWQGQLFNTLGVKADKFTPENMDTAFKKVGGEFDALTKGKDFTVGGQYIDDINQTYEEIGSTLGKEAQDIFQKESLKIIDDFSKGDTISGDIIAKQRARINGLARKAKGERKDALLDLERVLVDNITSKDPALKASLTEAKKRYKNLIALEPLAVKAKGGMISPSQLNNRVSRIYGRQYTTGKAGEIGDLAKIGYELLPELGGSDTLQKAAYLGAAASLANPASTALAGGAILGSRALQKGIIQNPKMIERLTRETGESALSKLGRTLNKPLIKTGVNK